MLVRGEGLSATMSKYLIDEIARTSNIVVEAQTQVLEAIGDERLKAISCAAAEANGKCQHLRCLFLSARSRARMASALHPARREGISAGRARPAHGRQVAGSLAGDARAVSAGEQRAGRLCGRRCAAWLGEARGLRGRRGLHRGAVCSPVSGGILVSARLCRRFESGM